MEIRLRPGDFEQLLPPSPIAESPQLTFFTAKHVLGHTGLRADEAERLHQAGLISFDPATESPLEDAQRAELQFVSQLAARGCDVAAIRALTSSLARPLAYEPGALVFSFERDEWLQRTRPSLAELAQHLVEHIEHLDASSCGTLAAATVNRLTELAAEADDEAENDDGAEEEE